MKNSKQLILFGIIYGQLNGLVGLVLLIHHFVYTETGKDYCLKVSLEPGGCAGALDVISILAVVYVSIRAIRVFLKTKKESEQEKIL